MKIQRAMFETIHISVDNLNDRFIENLREQYPHAALEIKVDKKTNGDSLSEQQFWSIIHSLDWSKGDENSDAVIEPAVKKLVAHPVRHIYEFQDILAKKLHALDTRAHAENAGENAWKGENDFFSVDEFLYARCCVVANGEAFFKQVLKDPTAMPQDLTFEALLRIARKAYRLK
ncbi:MAG: DUF4240 domain-containing protein, partial [Bacteroidota bacterium]